MRCLALPRRSVLLLPFALAACGGEEEPDQAYPALRYNYLPPIELNVASISIEQRFVPAGVPPDVTSQDPEPPIEALKAMANDRLMAFGTENKAVFAILDASMARNDDAISGSFLVSLTLYDNTGTRLGFAQAQVRSQHTGPVGNLHTTLYDLTKAMMADMNVEFEYQIRQNLKSFLTAPTTPGTPVQQTPLDQSGNPPAPSDTPAAAPAPQPMQLPVPLPAPQ